VPSVDGTRHVRLDQRHLGVGVAPAARLVLGRAPRQHDEDRDEREREVAAGARRRQARQLRPHPRREFAAPLRPLTAEGFVARLERRVELRIDDVLAFQQRPVAVALAGDQAIGLQPGGLRGTALQHDALRTLGQARIERNDPARRRLAAVVQRAGAVRRERRAACQRGIVVRLRGERRRAGRVASHGEAADEQVLVTEEFVHRHLGR